MAHHYLVFPSGIFLFIGIFIHPSIYLSYIQWQHLFSTQIFNPLFAKKHLIQSLGKHYILRPLELRISMLVSLIDCVPL